MSKHNVHNPGEGCPGCFNDVVSCLDEQKKDNTRLRAELEAAERELLIIKDNRDQWRTWCSEAQIREANTKEDYLALLASKDERLAAMEKCVARLRDEKLQHDFIMAGYKGKTPAWGSGRPVPMDARCICPNCEAVDELDALASLPSKPAPRQENLDG